MKIEVGKEYKVDFTTCSKKSDEKEWTLLVVKAEKGYDQISVFADERLPEVEKGDTFVMKKITAVVLGTESYEDKNGKTQYVKKVTINGKVEVQ